MAMGAGSSLLRHWKLKAGVLKDKQETLNTVLKNARKLSSMRVVIQRWQRKGELSGLRTLYRRMKAGRSKKARREAKERSKKAQGGDVPAMARAMARIACENGSGRVSKEEISKHLIQGHDPQFRAWGEWAAQGEHFKQHDCDGDGRLNIKELEGAVRSYRAYLKQTEVARQEQAQRRALKARKKALKKRRLPTARERWRLLIILLKDDYWNTVQRYAAEQGLRKVRLRSWKHTTAETLQSPVAKQLQFAMQRMLHAKKITEWEAFKNRPKRALSGSEMQVASEIFTRYDEDQSHSIDSTELDSVLKALGLNLDPLLVDQLIRFCKSAQKRAEEQEQEEDDDCCELDFDEFCNMLVVLPPINLAAASAGTSPRT